MGLDRARRVPALALGWRRGSRTIWASFFISYALICSGGIRVSIPNTHVRSTLNPCLYIAIRSQATTFL